MKAFLLSAGKGTRLGNLTDSIPKCLLPVAGKAMLDHWFLTLSSYGITDILINTHHLPHKVVEHCATTDHSMNITFTYEKELKGTAKTIYKNKDFVKDDRYFLIIYTDTWMQIDLHSMLKYQKKHSSIGTLGVYKPKNLNDQGVIHIENRKIVQMEEKPSHPNGEYAFAGIMIGSHAMFRFYNEGMEDLARDWLPHIKEGLCPFFIEGLVYDIGTPERYKEANEKVRGLGLKGL